MVNESENTVELETRPIELPAITPKAGWTTSQGQMTAIFGIVSMVLAFFGWKFSPEEINNIYELVMQAVFVLGPVVAFAKVLYEYINSRGKTYSNAINASASLTNSANVAGIPGLGQILGGKNWKDPKRYINILDTVSDMGVIPGPAGKVLDELFQAEPTEEEIAQIIQVLQNHEKRIKGLEGGK